MTALLLDTHVWVWSLFDRYRLTKAAINALESSSGIWVSPVSLYEISHKVRLGKWPEMDRYVPVLPDLLEQQGALAALVTPEIALRAGMLDWPHRDPFDRLIAATAIEAEMSLLSADAAFDAGLTGLRRIW